MFYWEKWGFYTFKWRIRRTQDGSLPVKSIVTNRTWGGKKSLTFQILKRDRLDLVCWNFFVTIMTVDFPAEHWAGGSFMMSFSSLFIRFWAILVLLLFLSKLNQPNSSNIVFNNRLSQKNMKFCNRQKLYRWFNEFLVLFCKRTGDLENWCDISLFGHLNKTLPGED